MSVKFKYTKLVLDKIRRQYDRVAETYPVPPRIPGKKWTDPHREARREALREMNGMSWNYLGGVLDGHYEDPSSRVLLNLGFKVFIQDMETGEMEEVEVIGRCEIDHSQPANPRFIRD